MNHTATRKHILSSCNEFPAPSTDWARLCATCQGKHPGTQIHPGKADNREGAGLEGCQRQQVPGRSDAVSCGPSLGTKNPGVPAGIPNSAAGTFPTAQPNVVSLVPKTMTFIFNPIHQSPVEQQGYLSGKNSAGGKSKTSLTPLYHFSGGTSCGHLDSCPSMGRPHQNRSVCSYGFCPLLFHTYGHFNLSRLSK